MWEIIRYQLSHLVDFSGRDSRRTFWIYVLFLVIVQIIISIVIAAPMLGKIIADVMQGAQSGMSEAQIQEATYAGIADSLGPLAITSMTLNLLTTVLLVASFARRLHDAGYNGWFAIIPLATQGYSQVVNFLNMDNVRATMDQAIASGTPEFVMAAEAEAAGAGLIGWLGILFVVIFGVMKSQAGPNRYGEAPARP